MRTRIIVGASLAVAMLVSIAIAKDKEPLTSGPKVGSGCTPFEPEHITGPDEGTKRCLVWKYGGSPVVLVFAREISAPVTSLVKKVEAATAKDKNLHGFVVFLNDKEGLDKDIKALAKKEKIEKVPLTKMDPAGPEAYKVNKDADVVVVFYKGKSVKANRAFRKGEFKEKDVDAVLKDLSKIAKSDD